MWGNHNCIGWKYPLKSAASFVQNQRQNVMLEMTQVVYDQFTAGKL